MQGFSPEWQDTSQQFGRFKVTPLQGTLIINLLCEAEVKISKALGYTVKANASKFLCFSSFTDCCFPAHSLLTDQMLNLLFEHIEDEAVQLFFS